MSQAGKAQQILFVTGKGGVGKSVVAAALALQASRNGKRVLLAELGSKSFYAHFLGPEGQGASASNLLGVSLTRWDGQACLREYVLHYLKLGSTTDLFMENKVARALLRLAPGLSELAIIGKITSGARHSWSRHPYDLIIVDSYSTGHFMALLKAPRGMAETISMGHMGTQCRSILEVIRDPEQCQYLIVTLPEELPVSEACELGTQIGAEVGITPQLLCNKLMPDVLAEEVETLHRSGISAAELFLQHMRLRYEQQHRSLVRLQSEFEMVRTLPYCFETEPDRLLSALAEQV